MGDSVKDRYAAVLARIDAAARLKGRRGSEIHLVAVTKYASIDQIRELLQLGHQDLGESRAQVMSQHMAQVAEYLERSRTLPSAALGRVPEFVRWHMIGHLQRNKVRKIVGSARLIHSVDSLRLAEEIQTAAAAKGVDAEILIQVDIAGEKQKYGIAPAAVRHLIDQLDTMFNLRVRGLMCMAPRTENPEDSRPIFTRCSELFEDIKKIGCAGERFQILSMGMSGDFDIAVECGANLVRVGSAIFGSRSDTDDHQAHDSSDSGDAHGSSGSDGPSESPNNSD